MAPTITIPPPVYTNQPFFRAPDPCSPVLESSAPGSPCGGMERSIRRVMSRYGAGDLHGGALLPSYRCLRRRRPQEENQAVAVTHDDNTYKIMLDVRDFADGSLSVRAVGENELVVEGIVQKKEESSPSETCRSFQSSSRNFQQRFMFPGLQVEGVNSSVSSDGVLTVTAPRKVTEDKAVEFQMPVTQSSQSTSLSSQATSQTTNLSQGSPAASQLMPADATSSVQSAVTAVRGEHIVPIEVEGQLLINRGGDVASNYAAQTLDSTLNKTSNTSLQSSVQQQSSLTSQQQSGATQAFKQADTKEQLSSQDRVATQNNSVMNVPIATRSLGQTSIFDSMFKDSLVPIDTRGLFFQDSFFENSRRDFQDAINQVMKRVSVDTGSLDPMSWYKTHRTTNLLEDSRAGTITTEGNDYKIVLDVRDFEEGTVSVRASGDSELLVEGQVEKKTEGTSISRRFRRRFVMPGHVKCEAITSALSSDGVLTITAPKQGSSFKLVELTGNNTSLCNKSLTNSSIFGTNASSCPSPIVSVPASSVTSPTSDMAGPFEPVFSKNIETSASTDSQTARKSETNVTEKKTQNVIEQSTIQASVNQCLNDSSKIINNQREHLVPIEREQSTVSSSNEKVVNINYIDKNQNEIDSQSTRNIQQETSGQQFQLIGTVKDLTDVNLKESVKERRRLSSLSDSTSQDRNVSIRYDNPAGFAFPIVRRGPFYQDSFFNEVHQNFQTAIRQVLDRWVDVPSLLFSNTNTSSLCNFDRFHSTLSNYRSILDHDFYDDLTCYKSLRHRSLKEENQAATVKENSDDFKIVLDVHGFSEKDLVIRATSHNALVVEGKVEEKSTGSASSHTFRKQFILPGPVRMDTVYSALSADDVLTITVPKNTALSITDKA